MMEYIAEITHVVAGLANENRKPFVPLDGVDFKSGGTAPCVWLAGLSGGDADTGI